MKYTIYLILLLLFSQCQVEDPDNVTINHAKEAETDPFEGYETHAITLIDTQIKIKVPGLEMVGRSPELTTSNAGIINMKIGKNFHLEILEGDLNIDATISDFGNDIFYKTTILTVDEERLVYEKSLPDGSRSLVNFMMKKNMDGVPVIIRSATHGQFRKAHVDRMMKSASTIEINNEIVMK